MSENESNVVEFPIWRKSPLRRRARMRKLLNDQLYPPLPDDEPKLTWEHWAGGLVIAGSVAGAIIVLIAS